MLIGVGFRRRSARQAVDLPCDGGVNLGRLFTPSGAFDGATFDGSHFDADTGRVTLTNSGGINLLEAVKAAVQFMIREGIAMDLQKRLQGDALA